MIHRHWPDRSKPVCERLFGLNSFCVSKEERDFVYAFTYARLGSKASIGDGLRLLVQDALLEKQEMDLKVLKKIKNI